MARRAAVPISYNDFRQRVRRHRRTDVLRMVAAVNAAFERARYDKGSPPPVTNTMQPFTLAGVARTALISGNDHRSATLKATDLQEMCDAYANIVDPALKTEAGSRRSRAIFNRATYEQFGDQVSPMEGIGRTLSLLYDHAPSCPTAPRN